MWREAKLFASGDCTAAIPGAGNAAGRLDNSNVARPGARATLPAMASLLSGLLGVLVATNQPSAMSNLLHEKTGARIEVADTNDPVEREYLRLLEMDDAAQAEVDRWLTDNSKLAGTGASIDSGTMQGKIRQR